MNLFRRVQGLTVVTSVILFSLSSIASSLHFASVGHAICDEHGELIHTASSHHDSHATSAEDSRDVGLSGFHARSQNHAQGHGHEHCILAIAQGQSCLQTAVAQDLPLPVLTSIASAHPTLFIAASTYRTAPKTSPPA